MYSRSVKSFHSPYLDRSSSISWRKGAPTNPASGRTGTWWRRPCPFRTASWCATGPPLPPADCRGREPPHAPSGVDSLKRSDPRPHFVQLHLLSQRLPCVPPTLSSSESSSAPLSRSADSLRGVHPLRADSFPPQVVNETEWQRRRGDARDLLVFFAGGLSFRNLHYSHGVRSIRAATHPTHWLPSVHPPCTHLAPTVHPVCPHRACPRPQVRQRMFAAYNGRPGFLIAEGGVNNMNQAHKGNRKKNAFHTATKRGWRRRGV